MQNYFFGEWSVYDIESSDNGAAPAVNISEIYY